MKLKKILYIFFLFAIFISITNIANAAVEFNIISVTLNSPVEPGATPTNTIDLEFKNDNGDSSLSYTGDNALKIEWFDVDSTTFSKFEEGNTYEFALTDEEKNRVSADLNGTEYSLSDDYYIIFNGERIPEGDSLSFLAGANKEESWTIPELVENQPLPQKATVKFSNPLISKEKKFTVTIKWYDENFTECDGNAEIGKKYTWGLGDLNYLNVIEGGTREEFINNLHFRDFRTKLYINNTLSQNGSLGEFSVVPSNTITLDTNGGLFSDNTEKKNIIIANDYNYSNLEKPTRDGYTFAGYFTEKTDGISLKSIMQGTEITGNTTFYARWKKNVDKVTVDLTETTNVSLSEAEFDAIRFAENKGLLVQNHTPVIIYYYNQDGKFLFSYDRNYSFNFNDELSTNDNVKYSISEDEKIVYAEDGNGDVVPNKVEIIFGYYNVTFDANGGKFANSNTTLTNSKWLNSEYNYDSIEKPIRDGYTFVGFYTEKNGGTDLRGIMESAGIKKDITLYAQWKENSTSEGQVQLTPNPENNSQSTPSTTQPSQDIQTTQTNNPKTGDTITLWISILVISLSGLVLIKKKK